MTVVTACVDDIQAGDIGEIYEAVAVLKPDSSLLVHLWMVFRNEMPEIEGVDSRERFLQNQTDRPSYADVCGRVIDAALSFNQPTDTWPEGLTHLETLVIANEIPISLDYFWPGQITPQVPRRDSHVRARGPLLCEPSFSTRAFFSPVSAIIEESVRLKDAKSSGEEGDYWGRVRLRLISELRNHISRVSNLGKGAQGNGKFLKISMYNPPAYSLGNDGE